MEVFVRFTFLLLCLAELSGAAPTDNNGYLAITGSSDAWASLVANVAPLLLLIGEKNVKSYFKTISQPSQAYLYAASPIGLITAIVTAIRLGNSALMKRLIGRQHESRAEILADVTSISGGSVGFELKGLRNMLEQTIDPKPEDEAHFWIHGRVMGTGREGLRFRDAVEAIVQNASTAGYRALGEPSAFKVPLHEPLYATRFLKHIASRLCGSRVSLASQLESTPNIPSAGTQRGDNIEDDNASLGREPWWLVNDIPDAVRICIPDAVRICEATVVTVFEATGPNATETARLYAAQWARCGIFKDLSLDCDQAEDSDSGLCSSRSLACISWPDVSHTLTTTVNVQVSLLYFSRVVVIALCLSANTVLVVLNWRAQHHVMTTIFVSLGLLGSYSFSVWTATLVGRSTRQATIPVQDIQPFQAGFLSNNFPLGVRMAYSPKRVVMSMERNTRSHNLEEGPFWYIPLFVIMSTAAFLMMCLGLRAAKWWLSFAMCGIVGFATCMRAILTIDSPLDSPDFHKSTGPIWNPITLYGPSSLWLLHLWENMGMKEECRPSFTQHRRATEQKAFLEDNPTIERHTLPPTPTSLFSRLNIKKIITRVKPQSDQSRKHGDLLSRQKLAIPETIEPLIEHWTVVATSQHCTGLDGNKMRMLKRSAGLTEYRLVEASFVVARVIAECHLLPHDFSSSNHEGAGYGRKGAERARLHLLRSEFISQKGIWQQPLEVAVRDVEDGVPPPGLVVTFLKTWAVQAFLGGQMLSNSIDFSRTAESRKYASAVYRLLLRFPDGHEPADRVTIGELWELERQALDEGFSGMCKSNSCDSTPSIQAMNDDDGCPAKLHEFPAGDLDPKTADRLNLGMWSCPWMLWMSVKIVLALSGQDYLRRCAVKLSGADDTRSMDCMSKWHGLNWARDYVNFLKAAGLLKPSSEIPVTTRVEMWREESCQTTNTQVNPMSLSLTQRGSSGSPRSTPPTVLNGGGTTSDNDGYMSFG